MTVSEGYGSTIQAAVDQFAQHTCITWKPRENEERWVTFVKKSGCVEPVLLGLRCSKVALPYPLDKALSSVAI